MSVAPFVLNALDHLDQGITVIDGDLRVVAWNRHMADLLGFPSSMMRNGVPLETLIRFNAERGEYGPGDVEALVTERMELARRFQPHCFERTRPDGTIIEVKGNPLEGGGFVTVYSDITARREAELALQRSAAELESRVGERTASLHALNRDLRDEMEAHRQTAQALRESGQWLKSITDRIPVLIAYLSPDMQCRFANQRADEWFGPMDGNDDIGVLRRNFIDTLAEHARIALKGRAVNHEIEFRDSRGMARIASVDLVPHESATAGEAQGLFLLAQDITDYKATQAALLESSKLNAVGHLTGALAHDFGNMLAIVQGNLSFVQQLTGKDNPEVSDCLTSCLRTLDRGADLTRRLLAFARRQSLKPRVIDVRVLLEDLDALTRHPLGDRVRLRTRIDDQTATVQADPSGLESALLNLLFNARDAMPEGGEICIDASNLRISEHTRSGLALGPGAYVKLSVKDNGEGIDACNLPHVMEPFFTTKRVGAGTGLGLSTVYGFVRQSRGDIRIHSRRGKGTRVDVYLPTVESHDTSGEVA